MQRVKKILIVSTIFSLSFFAFLFFFNKQVSAQSTPTVSTTRYSVLNINTFILGGAYSGNTEQKPFTTYFEYKRNNSNLNETENREETVKIVRNTNVGVSNNFYSSPSLQINSIYYFRAVGYFNDNETQKFYGNVLSFQTGGIYVAGSWYSSGSTDADGVFYPLVVECTLPEVRNIITNICEPVVGCASGQTRNIITNECQTTLDCNNTGQVLDIINGVCITPVNCVQTNEVRNIITNKCEIFASCSATEVRNIITGECEASIQCSANQTRNIITGKCEILEDCSKTNQVRNIITGKCETILGSTTPATPPTTPPSSPSESSETPPPPTDGLVVCINNCDFNAFIDLLNKVTRFILFYMAVPIAAIMFAYAGFLLVTAGGAGEKTKAKNIFTNTVIGLIIAAGAWLVVKTLLSIVSKPDMWSWIGF